MVGNFIIRFTLAMKGTQSLHSACEKVLHREIDNQDLALLGIFIVTLHIGNQAHILMAKIYARSKKCLELDLF